MTVRKCIYDSKRDKLMVICLSTMAVLSPEKAMPIKQNIRQIDVL